MTLQEKANKILEILKKEYPIVETPLVHKNVYELLIATMLSPQTNDNTTNIVTPTLFAKYPTIEDLTKANIEDIEDIIRYVNYYRTKSKNIIKASQIILEKFNGKIPSKMLDLIELPGVGRKIANVVVSEWYVKHEGFEPEGFVVDTHVARVSQRLGLTKNKDPYKIEKDLMQLFPKEEWNNMSLRFIFHGRNYCTAKNPTCYKHPEFKYLCSCAATVPNSFE